MVASSETACRIVVANDCRRPKYFPLDKEYPVDPMDSYAMSKIVNGATAKAFHARLGADIHGLRIGNVVDPVDDARTLVTKSNAMHHGMVLWDEVFFEVARNHPDVHRDRELVDAATTRMVLKPGTLDVIVATANLNPSREFPSMFEPIHGSAFDIVGRGIANPIGTFWSIVRMLEHLGEPAAAAKLMAAIEATTRSGVHTPDLGGTATTADVTEAVCRALDP